MEATGVDSVIPGMLANLVFLIGSHYLFKEPGGWVGIKDGGIFEIVKKERRKRWEYYINQIKTFDLLKDFFLPISICSIVREKNTYRLNRNKENQYFG